MSYPPTPCPHCTRFTALSVESEIGHMVSAHAPIVQGRLEAIGIRHCAAFEFPWSRLSRLRQAMVDAGLKPEVIDSIERGEPYTNRREG